MNSTLKASSLSLSSAQVLPENNNRPTGRTRSINPPLTTRQQAKCAVCQNRPYYVGLCRRHWKHLSINLERLTYDLLDVVVVMAEPGVFPLDEESDLPFVARTRRFLNDAAQHWNADFAEFKRKEKRSKKCPAA